MAVEIIGMAWYRQEDYAAVLRIMADAGELPETWWKWFYEAERAERALKRRRFTVIRVPIDPETFPSWCEFRGLKPDADARSKFASEHASIRA